MDKRVLSKNGIGFILAIFSALLWGTNGTFCAILSELGLSTINIAELAPMFIFVFNFLVLVLTNRSAFKVEKKYLLLLMIDGIFSSGVNFSFVKSVTYFPVGIVSTLVYCNVFTIMILSRVAFKNKITLQKVIASIVAVIGVGLVLDIFSAGFSLNYFGLLWIILTISMWSMMVTIEKYLLDHSIDGNAVLMYMGLFAVIGLSFISPPWTLVQSIVKISDQTAGMALLAVFSYGMLPQIGCYYFYIKSLQFIEPSYIQVAYSLDPVTAVILGYFIFNQSMNLTQILGILLILTVVGYVQVKESKM
ncbi:DMT family transporter [Desulfosporosinus sp. SB140]|uniref:DMT family transporter n=1 Tax=Desulfosporosinus paludis TaxID=3115649 RepID=UPI0038910173